MRKPQAAITKPSGVRSRFQSSVSIGGVRSRVGVGLMKIPQRGGRGIFLYKHFGVDNRGFVNIQSVTRRLETGDDAQRLELLEGELQSAVKFLL